MELFAVDDGEVEEDEVQRLHVRHVRPAQDLRPGVGAARPGDLDGAAERAGKVEEAVAEQHLLRRGPEALLEKKMP